MPKKVFTEGLPYPPLIKLDQDAPVQLGQITALLRGRRDGLSLCVRSKSGQETRGGYFFHILYSPTGAGYILTDFDKIPVTRTDGSSLLFSEEDLCEFINHCTGSHFSEKMLLLCQTEINFRLDQTEGDESDSED